MMSEKPNIHKYKMSVLNFFTYHVIDKTSKTLIPQYHNLILTIQFEKDVLVCIDATELSFFVTIAIFFAFLSLENY